MIPVDNTAGYALGHGHVVIAKSLPQHPQSDPIQIYISSSTALVQVWSANNGNGRNARLKTAARKPMGEPQLS